MSEMNTALSGIHASINLLNVSAENTANVNTDGFKKVNATINEGKNGGVVVSLGNSEQTGPAYQVQTTGKNEPSNTDLALERVDQLTAKRMLQLSASALQAEAQVKGGLLDTLA